MKPAQAQDGSWADVFADGRLPLFALICLGVWLGAADSLVTATIMPSVGADLGGYAYFGWATAGYLLGSVLAGASSGLLAQRYGLPVLHVENASELRPEWFLGCRRLGLTAGTSTLPATIEAVHARLRAIAAAEPRESSPERRAAEPARHPLVG